MLRAGLRGYRVEDPLRLWHSAPTVGDLLQRLVPAMAMPHQPAPNSRACPPNPAPAMYVHGPSVVHRLVYGVKYPGHLRGAPRNASIHNRVSLQLHVNAQLVGGFSRDLPIRLQSVLWRRQVNKVIDAREEHRAQLRSRGYGKWCSRVFPGREPARDHPVAGWYGTAIAGLFSQISSPLTQCAANTDSLLRECTSPKSDDNPPRGRRRHAKSDA